MRTHRMGFTLIELLVVVTIIVVLLALLMPAMDKAIESAQRAVCATRLHAFGLGITHYFFDNQRKVPIPVHAYGGPYPNLARHRNSQGPGQWSGELMRPYIGGVDLESGIYGEQWYCPSNGKTPVKDAANANSALDVRSGLAPAWGWVALDYAYFARINPANATFPEDLVGKNDLASGKLLMADTIYYWQGGGKAHWWFNHHREGASVHDAPWGAPNMTHQAIEGISGTNRLLGDGAVAWKDGSLFKPDLMWQPSAETTWVSPLAGPDPTKDLNFY